MELSSESPGVDGILEKSTQSISAIVCNFVSGIIQGVCKEYA